MEKKNSDYDKRKVFEAKVRPLLTEVKKACKIAHLPFFFACAVSNNKKNGDKGGTEYELDGVLPGSEELALENDMFRKYILLSRGIVDITDPADFVYSDDYYKYLETPPENEVPVQKDDAKGQDMQEDLDDELSGAEEVSFSAGFVSIGDI